MGYYLGCWTKGHLKNYATDLFVHAYELMLCLHAFRQTGPPRRVDCLAPSSVVHIKMEAFECLAQGHNKQACRQAFGTGSNDQIMVVFANVPTSI